MPDELQGLLVHMEGNTFQMVEGRIAARKQWVQKVVGEEVKVCSPTGRNVKGKIISIVEEVMPRAHYLYWRSHFKVVIGSPSEKHFQFYLPEISFKSPKIFRQPVIKRTPVRGGTHDS